MKKTVRVIIEKDIEVEIDDDKLSDEFIALFESFMWPVDGTDDLFEYAARQHALYDITFIDGLGPVNLKEKSMETEEFIVA